MKEEKLFLLGGDLRGHGPWTPGRNQRLQRFFLATILRPTFSPCRVYLSFGAATDLGRPITWSDQAACSGKPLCSPSPGGFSFPGGF